MYYVYIIRSKLFPSIRYVGCTSNIKKRIYDHNSGTTAYTSKYLPWELVMYVAFNEKLKAYAFEQYLKSHAGRTFAQKRLL